MGREAGGASQSQAKSGSSAANTAAGESRCRIAPTCARRRTACAKRCSTGSGRLLDGAALPRPVRRQRRARLRGGVARRGARRAWSSRTARSSCASQTTSRAIGARQVELVRADAFDYLGGATSAFDVVFLDPPFRQNALPAVLRAAAHDGWRPERWCTSRRARPARARRSLARIEARARGPGELPAVRMETR